MFQFVKRQGKIIDKINTEAERAALTELEAKVDYAIMMGYIDDPAEGDDGDEQTL